MVFPQSRRSRVRTHRVESLEERRLLAVWQNPSLAFDVNGDGLVTAQDALLVINELSRRHGSGAISELSPVWVEPTAPFFDVNGDHRLTPIDALLVINALSRNPSNLAVVAGLSSDSDPNGNAFVSQKRVQIRGETAPNATVQLTHGAVDASLVESIIGETALVSSDDRGQFVSHVDLQPGRNRLRLQVTDELGRTVGITREVVLGDIVTDWNAAVLNVVRDWTTTSDDPYFGRIVPSAPPEVARNLAMIHTAMFDAINGVAPRYSAYHVSEPAPAGASALAAGATAAYEVARSLYPEPREQAVWDATLSESLRLVPDGPGKRSGIEYGEAVAAAILALRADDGSASESSYRPADGPGQWNRTAPNFLPPLVPHWGNVRPFAVEDVITYRPPPPPELSSAEYATAVDEVMRLGRLTGSERTAEQTAIARFWVDGAGTATPPGHWNRIATQIAFDRGQSLLENARTLALLNLALADAGIASWDAKYGYDFWRPIDAIRRAAEDGNAETQQDPQWLPLIITPCFPAYTSGHSSFSGAGAAVLTALYGDNVAFASRSDGHTGLTQRPLAETTVRHFASFEQAAEEAGMSRIYGGIHFMFDNTTGLDAGRSIGSDVVRDWLLPLTDGSFTHD